MKPNEDLWTTLNSLFETIENRKSEYEKWVLDEKSSYTVKLLSEWVDGILKKIWEESTEVILWAKNWDKENVIYEISDLLYFLNVLMVQIWIKPEQIANEISRRFWRSGIDEKNSRTS